MILIRKALRDIQAMGIRAVLLVLVIGVGAGMAGGIGLALRDVQVTRNAFYARQHLAGLDVRLRHTLPADALLARAHGGGASLAETRLVFDGSASRNGSSSAAEVVGMAPDARLNQLVITAGRTLSDTAPLGAVVEAEYANKTGLRPGDSLTVAIAGRSLRLRVRGLARSPEYLLATADPQFLIPQPGSLAVVFLPKTALAAAVGAPGQANDLVADFPRGTAPARERAIAAGLPVARLTFRSAQYSLRFTNADLRSFRLFVPVLQAVFGAVGFLLIGLSLRRIVHSQRRELGTLLAIGYQRSAVLATAMLPAAVLAIPGAAVAIAVAIGVARLVAGTYAAAAGFPAITTTLAPGPLAETAGLAAAAAIIAGLLPAWTLARLSPTAAMRGEPPARFTLPGWLRRATGATGPSVTYASRTLTRQPLLTAATVISLAAAIGLGAALNLLASSTNQAVGQSFSGQRWTATVDLAGPVPVSTAVALARGAGVRRAEPVVTGPAHLRARGRGTDTELVGLPVSPGLRRFQITSGRLPRPGQVLLSEQTAQTLHVVPGERLRVSAPSGSRRLTVSGIARTLASGQSFLRYPDAAALLDLPGQATSLFVAASGPAIRGLAVRPGVVRVTTLAAARSGMRKLVRELTSLIDVLLVISLAVGGLFLISSLALSFLDRQGEFATLRAVGYGPGAVTVVVGTEALSESVAAGALSIPAGLLIAWPLAVRIGQAWFRIGLHPIPADFAVVITLAIAMALLVAVHATRRVLKINIARAVRARMAG